MCGRHECVLRRAMYFFFQAEDGIRDLVRSRGLGDVYKRQVASVGVRGSAGAMPGVRVWPSPTG